VPVVEPKKVGVASYAVEESVQACDLDKTLPIPERKRRKTADEQAQSPAKKKTKETKEQKVEQKVEQKSEGSTVLPRKSTDTSVAMLPDKEEESVEEKVNRIMEDAEKKKRFASIDQEERRYARLVSFRPPITIALLNTQPLVCGRERSEDDATGNFLEIGDLTLHKRAVSRRHFMITYDSDVNTFFIEVLSRNGIKLDGVEYHDGRHPLHSGSSISVQHFTMYFDIPEELYVPSRVSSKS